jgi:Cu-Zn family superoxide dismutase
MRNISGRPMATATVKGNRENPMLRGGVRFYQRPYGVLVEADIVGLPRNKSGFFGFHIHEGASCTGEGYSATGSHYDPGKRPHPNHAGDLPPLLSFGGRAYLAVVTDRFSIREILGRTVVIHSGADDFQTQPAGNAGTKIGCGVITRA